MPIKRRPELRRTKRPKIPDKLTTKRDPALVGRPYMNSVEEYVFRLPIEPIKYVDLVLKWIIPFQESSFEIFGCRLRLTPGYKHVDDDQRIVITSLLVELTGKRKRFKTKITGVRGQWNAKIKFFVKGLLGEENAD